MSRKGAQNHPGWDRTSEEYLDHVRRLEKMPSVVGAPRYPNLHMILKKKADYNKECEGHNESRNTDQASDPVKKAQFARQDETTEVNKNGCSLKLRQWGTFKST